jgi:hypothetical protein
MVISGGLLVSNDDVHHCTPFLYASHDSQYERRSSMYVSGTLLAVVSAFAIVFATGIFAFCAPSFCLLGIVSLRGVEALALLCAVLLCAVCRYRRRVVLAIDRDPIKKVCEGWSQDLYGSIYTIAIECIVHACMYSVYMNTEVHCEITVGRACGCHSCFAATSYGPQPHCATGGAVKDSRSALSFCSDC